MVKQGRCITCGEKAHQDIDAWRKKHEESIPHKTVIEEVG